MNILLAVECDFVILKVRYHLTALSTTWCWCKEGKCSLPEFLRVTQLHAHSQAPTLPTQLPFFFLSDSDSNSNSNSETDSHLIDSLG
jgi:hypothetical protein